MAYVMGNSKYQENIVPSKFPRLKHGQSESSPPVLDRFPSYFYHRDPECRQSGPNVLP